MFQISHRWIYLYLGVIVYIEKQLFFKNVFSFNFSKQPFKLYLVLNALWPPSLIPLHSFSNLEVKPTVCFNAQTWGFGMNLKTGNSRSICIPCLWSYIKQFQRSPFWEGMSLNIEKHQVSENIIAPGF